MTGARRPDHAMQIVEPHRAPRTVGPHNGRVTACEKERREALWMRVFVVSPTARWDVQAYPSWDRPGDGVCSMPVTSPATGGMPARPYDLIPALARADLIGGEPMSLSLVWQRVAGSAGLLPLIDLHFGGPCRRDHARAASVCAPPVAPEARHPLRSGAFTRANQTFR